MRSEALEATRRASRVTVDGSCALLLSVVVPEEEKGSDEFLAEGVTSTSLIHG